MPNPISSAILAEHVHAAIAALDASQPHDFGPSTKYDLIYEGRRYPPKAVLGLAAGFATGTRLVPSDFSGGEASKCFRVLRELGFEIGRKPSNDEPEQSTVAGWVVQGNPEKYEVDAYCYEQTFIYWMCPKLADQFQLGAPAFFKRSGLGGGIIASGHIAELPTAPSQLRLPQFFRPDLWRVPPPEGDLFVGIRLNEVRLTLDEGMVPTSQLSAMPALEGHPLTTVRQGTLFRLSTHQTLSILRAWGGLETCDQGDATEASEGRRRLTQHYRIERNAQLAKAKRTAFRREHGRLFCEVCRSDYEQAYGPDWCESVMEVHHKKPLGSLDGPCRTSLDDLLVVCSNCHRMIHRTRDASENLEQLLSRFGP